MDYLEIFSKLPHINGDGVIIDDGLCAISLCEMPI